MKTKIICILVMMLLISTTAMTVTGAINVDRKSGEIKINTKEISSLAPWTIQFSHDVTTETGASGNAGAEFDGTYFYTTRWATNLLHQYDSSGNMLKQFSIPGVTGLRDLAYCPVDGYLYGGAAGGTIWGFDPISETLMVTLTGSFLCRAIAYDENLDVFYVSNWGDPVWIVDRTTGTVNGQFNLGTTTSTYGFAYDNVCNGGGPYLWVYDQGDGAAQPQYISQWDLTTSSYTGVQHDTSLDFGSGSGIAGGLFLTTNFVSGYVTLGGLYQDGDPPGVADWLFCYELCEHTTCNADIDVEKYVLDPNTGNYVDADTRGEAIDLPYCTSNSNFKIVVTNTGDEVLRNVTVKDIMTDGLEYLGASPSPDFFQHTPPEYIMEWYIDEMDQTEEVVILIEFHVTGKPCQYDSNYVKVDGTCLPHGTYVEDEDWCWVHVKETSRDRPILDILERYLSMFPLLQRLMQILGL